MLSIVLHIRAILFAIFVVVHTLFCSIWVIIFLVLRLPRPWVDWLIGPLWCNLMVALSGMRVHVKGAENVPTDRGFLYVFTHSSHLDVPTLFAISPVSFRFGAKYSLFKIPIFGYAVKLSGTLPITREDRAKVMEVYKQTEERLDNGESFALAPEGGRRVGDEIKEFKSGPFIFGINARTKLVPVVMCGIDRALPKGGLLVNKDKWVRDVGVHFLPPVDASEWPLEKMKELKAVVREQMVTEFEAMKKVYLKD